MFRSACVWASLLLSLCLTETCEAGAVFTLGNSPQPNEQNRGTALVEVLGALMHHRPWVAPTGHSGRSFRALFT
jgi:hypothetical protein